MRSFVLAVSLAALAAAASAQVKVTQGSDRVMVDIGGKPFTALFTSAAGTKPYLHPLRTATGVIVTRVWPMEEKEGEAKDHIHHRGLWFSHGDVNGFDFWANDPSQQKGKQGVIRTKRITDLKSGKKDGAVGATFEWVTPAGKVLVNEARTMTFYSHPSLRVIDFDILLTSTEPAKFGDTKEGTFAMRLTAPLDGKHSGKMTSSTGAVGEKQVWGKRFPWVDYAGTVEGQAVGVAIFDHPGNPKHPTYWHARDYGLFAANIFGEHDFYNDKTRDGSMTLNPGVTWRFRYRVVIHPGDAASAGLAKLYDEWVKKTKK
ncbi:MAG: PmoA family protein [Bryobacterales bacterium]|nr:PmoA family protein [Bryobacterales bacterium]